MTTTYERTFKFSASHLNSADSYGVLWHLVMNGTETLTKDDLMGMVTDIHGHNFVVEVAIAGHMKEDAPWLVDDIALANVIKELDGINLSCLPFFLANHKRATTENLALYIWMHTHEVAQRTGAACVRVTVHETDDVRAVFVPSKLPPGL